MSVIVADIVAALDRRFPLAWAEPWDSVGLIAGDPRAAVEGVLVTLDQTREAVARARTAGANVVVSHHPAYIEAPARVLAGGGPAGVVHDALAARVALVAMHTNLDRDPEAAEALPRSFGWEVVSPLESVQLEMAAVTVFAPREAAAPIRAAMEAAGAGRVGLYAGCSFTADGMGAWRPLEGSAPVAQGGGADESRIEIVCGRRAAAAVVEAARSAHPYEEPLIVVADVKVRSEAARMGRLCEMPEGTTLDLAARRVAESLGVAPRVWGEPGTPVTRIAVATGSAAAMLPHALAAGAQALVCGELRYHDAAEAVSRGLCVIDTGHDASEWPMVPVLGEAVRSVPELDPRCVMVEQPATSWYTVPLES